MKYATLPFLTCLAFASNGLPVSGAAHETEAVGQTISPAFQYPIANVAGKTMSALVVKYAPGGKTPGHRHGSAFVVGYVLSGAIRSRVDNGPARDFHAGESWTEKPGAHHMISENASATEPAALLAIFVANSKDTNLVTVDK
jgi:quercetin dioxygenase-like cupin family protein